MTEEADEQFWIRKLRLAGDIEIDDYLDYLFGDSNAEEAGTVCKEGTKERQE